MPVSQLIGVQLVVFVCSSIPVVLFDNPGMFKCLNTLFLLRPNLCFIIGFICDLFVVLNDSWIRLKTSTRTEHIYYYHHGS